jgi:hypothetical protein
LSPRSLACAAGLATLLFAVPAQAASPPKLGKTAVVNEVSGQVTFIKKGETRFRALSESPTRVPMGSTIDARHGKIRIRTAGKGRGLDEATFWKGAFGIGQDKEEVVPEAVLVGEIGGTECGVGPSGGADVPRLWGGSDDAFRTVGRFSGVEVIEKDTKWLTEDLCDGTRHFAKRGRLRAYDGPVIENTVEPGSTIQHYCDYDGVEPASRWFCTMLNFSPHLGLFGTGIASLGVATTYDVCVTNPVGEESCESYQFSEPFTQEGHRFSVVVCSTQNGPGAYSARWLIDGVQLGPAVGFTSERPPGQDCIHRP